jgi:hypothetical protein
MEVLAPDAEEEFEITVSLVQEGVAWFSDLDPSNGFSAKVNVVQLDSSGEILSIAS